MDGQTRIIRSKRPGSRGSNVSIASSVSERCARYALIPNLAPHPSRTDHLSPLRRTDRIRAPGHAIVQTRLLDLIRVAGQNGALGASVLGIRAAADADGGGVAVDEGRAVAGLAVGPAGRGPRGRGAGLMSVMSAV